MERAGEAARRIVRRFGGNLLLIGHGASVRGMVTGLVDEADDFETPLCSLTKVVGQEGSWRLLTCADVSHLGETEETVRYQ